MTQYVFDLDAVSDRSSLSDGDVFTITPYLPNDEITRVQVGFCSGVYDVVCEDSHEPLAPNLWAAGAPYDITWDATLGKFTTRCTYVCTLTQLDGEPDFIAAPSSDPPPLGATRTIKLGVVPPGTAAANVSFFYSNSNTGLGMASFGPVWANGSPYNDRSDYEVRLVLADPVGDSWPAAMSGDAVDTWLPTTQTREWELVVGYEDGVWQSVQLDVILEFRNIRLPECTSRCTVLWGSDFVSLA